MLRFLCFSVTTIRCRLLRVDEPKFQVFITNKVTFVSFCIYNNLKFAGFQKFWCAITSKIFWLLLSGILFCVASVCEAQLRFRVNSWRSMLCTFDAYGSLAWEDVNCSGECHEVHWLFQINRRSLVRGSAKAHRFDICLISEIRLLLGCFKSKCRKMCALESSQTLMFPFVRAWYTDKIFLGASMILDIANFSKRFVPEICIEDVLWVYQKREIFITENLSTFFILCEQILQCSLTF